VNAAWVALGAITGAPARYLLDRAVQRRRRTVFPFGTLAVNLLACLLLGAVAELVAGGTAPAEVQLVAGTGFCATFSTYSTFSAETVALARRRAPALALANAVLSTVAGTLCAAAGYGCVRLATR
jgi:CrcB protein